MQNLYRLANVMGLDANNPQHTLALKESMSDIQIPNDFIEYCRTHKDGIEYANRVEKLDTLATRYKKNLNGVPNELLKDFSNGLANKFKTAITPLREHEDKLTRNIASLKTNGTSYFTDKEIKLLDATGTLNRLITMYELGTLAETLYSTSVELVMINRKPTLTAGQKKITAMITGGAV